MEKVTLYSKDAKDSIRVWSIHHDDKNIYMFSGLLGGEETPFTEPVEFGLGGRTREEQIEMRIKSRINKKLDSGYVYSLEDARNNVKTNSLGYLKAAKCSRYDEQKDKIPFTKTFVQPKLNGHHCSIVNDNGVKVAYSNGGKLITTIDHILNDFDLPVGRSVEGELYHHGTILQTISSWVRKKQENTKLLEFVCYDLVSKDCYTERFKTLQSFHYGANARLIETAVINGHFEVIPIITEHLKSGFEGTVLRLTGYPYEAGKRSAGMIKVKVMHIGGDFIVDDEFLIVDVGSSVDGCAVLWCETEEGRRFKVLCHGDVAFKKHVLKNKQKYIGKHTRVEFEGYTKDKKPFQPVSREFREKADE